MDISKQRYQEWAAKVRHARLMNMPHYESEDVIRHVENLETEIAQTRNVLLACGQAIREYAETLKTMGVSGLDGPLAKLSQVLEFSTDPEQISVKLEKSGFIARVSPDISKETLDALDRLGEAALNQFSKGNTQ